MSIVGWYYLHTNGQLIYKPNSDYVVADIRDSDLAKSLWPVDPSDRFGAWSLLIEALSAGANKDRVNELACKWGCNDNDAIIFAERAGVKLQMDGDKWCATRTDFTNLQEHPAGFGETALVAMSALCTELGYKPSKMWPQTFAKLVSVKQEVA